MTWTEIAAAPSAGKAPGAAVLVSCKPAFGKTSPQDRLTITFRPELIGPSGAWIAWRAAVRVLLGDGEHRGRLRIEHLPGGAHSLRSTGGTAARKLVRPCLVLVGLPWIPSVRHASAPVRHDAGDGWIEVVLPSWCVTPPPPAAVQATAAAPAPGPKPNGRGYSGVDHLPDPVAQGRRGVGAVTR